MLEAVYHPDQTQESGPSTEQLVLMSRTKEVKNHLYRVECVKRNLNEKRIPLAHSTVPETWELESLELAALIAL